MRLDKFLKVSRVIKRRTVANDAADSGRVLVNGEVKKPSYDVKIGDIIEIKFGDKTSRFQIVKVPEKQVKDVSELIEEAYQGVKAILNKFRDDKTPYTASPRPDKIKYNDYALLSREKEWLTADDLDDED